MYKDHGVRERVLGNGFKILSVEDHSHPLVSVQLYMRVGSAWETEGEAGYSHFAEHLVFKSTESYPQGRIFDKVAYLGGSMNAYTEYDSTCFYVEVASKYLDESIKMLSELVRKNNFSDEEFEFEKMVIIEELKEGMNDPEDHLLERAAENYLARGRYARSIIGNMEHLQSSKAADLRTFIDKHYLPNNSYMVIVGDYVEEDLYRFIEEYFGDWQVGAAEQRKAVLYNYSEGFGVEVIKHQSKSDIIAIALPALADSRPDSIALSLALKSFCLGKNSFLYEDLLKRRRLVDSIKLDMINGLSDGLSMIVLFPRNGVEPGRVINAFYESYHDFCSRGMSAVQLMKMRSEIINAYRMAREYVGSYASSLGVDEIANGYQEFYEYPGKMQKVTRLDIRRVIDTWLSIDNMKIYYHGQKEIDKEGIRQLYTQPHRKSITSAGRSQITRILPNGLEVVYHQVKGKPTIGMCASFKVSQVYESASERGLNLLTSALLLYGNKLYSYDKFLDFCVLHGMNFTVEQQMDLTSIRGKCFEEDIAFALEALSALLFEPELPREHFDIIKNSLLSNWDRNFDYAHKEAMYLWRKMYFGSKSRLFMKAGMKNEFKKQTLAKVRKWHEQFYTPDNMHLAITGDIDIEVIDEMVEKYFGNKTGGKVSKDQDYNFYPSEVRTKRKDGGSSQAVIILGGGGPGIENQEEQMWMRVLCQALGGDTNSMLFNELREKNGLAYSVDMDYYSNYRSGVYLAMASVDRDKTRKALKLIKEVLSRFAAEGISEYELNKIKNHMAGQMLQQEESVTSLAVSLSQILTLDLGMDYFDKRYEKLSSVTVENIKYVAEKYLDPENYYIQVLK